MISALFAKYAVKIIASLVAAIVLVVGGFYVGYRYEHSALLSYQQQVTQATATAEAQYQQRLDQLNSQIAGLQAQLVQVPPEAQKIITQFVATDIPILVKENPKDYQCVVPASGMQVINQSAAALNATRMSDAQDPKN